MNKYLTINESINITRTNYAHLYYNKERLGFIKSGKTIYLNEMKVKVLKKYLQIFGKKLVFDSRIYKVKKCKAIVYDTLQTTFSRGEVIRIFISRGYHPITADRWLQGLKTGNLIKGIGKGLYVKNKNTILE
ncbi:MAG: hypothetical protein NTW16_00215 [Bacteroidetes bacterium]|nr:hypothetical protein [Bacteroidota bacterium]